MTYKTDELANQIKVAREAASLSQRELSALSGVTQAHISQIESGKLNPGVATIVDIGRALDMEVVLVPKRMLSAVNSLIQPAPTARPGLSPLEGGAALQEIAKGERLIASHKERYGTFTDLDRMADYLRFFKRVSLRPDEIRVISRAVALLNDYESGVQWGVAFMDEVKHLQSLRNQLAHGQAEEPRSAYSLDEDDDA